MCEEKAVRRRRADYGSEPRLWDQGPLIKGGRSRLLAAVEEPFLAALILVLRNGQTLQWPKISD